MISDEKIIANRCGRPGCGIVYVLVARRQLPFYIPEFAGTTPCENITGHDMSEWTRVTITRDVLILRALWTVGRSVTPGLPIDPTAHILADSLGWEPGDPAPLSDLPSWLRGSRKFSEVTWEAVIMAERVAERIRDQWPAGHHLHIRWNRIVSYLSTWNDRVH